MPMPSRIGVIDLMMQVPSDDTSKWYEFLRPLLLDDESRKVFEFLLVLQPQHLHSSSF